jgi:ABC-type nitrate/sulfonate/bicarbonate transport system ATPase subunit
VLTGGQKQRLARALVSRPRVRPHSTALGALTHRISMQKMLERLWLDQRLTAISSPAI